MLKKVKTMITQNLLLSVIYSLPAASVRKSVVVAVMGFTTKEPLISVTLLVFRLSLDKAIVAINYTVWAIKCATLLCSITSAFCMICFLMKINTSHTFGNLLSVLKSVGDIIFI